jgi:predicted ATPase
MPKSHSHLQECSLILAVEDGGVTRYRMLEQLRQFAETRLDPADRLTVGRRHLDYSLAFARA